MRIKNIWNIVLILINSLIIGLITACGVPKKVPIKKIKVLYFNDRDPKMYNFGPVPFSTIFGEDTIIDKAYSKGINKKGFYYYDIEDNTFTSVEKNKRTYLPKDKLKNYRIIKRVMETKNIKLLDMSNPDSAFIVIVNKNRNRNESVEF